MPTSEPSRVASADPPGPGGAPSLPQEWELLGRLGRGGMGEVWRARHRLTGAQAAVKCILPRRADDETFARRFLQEVAVLDGLIHPRVVRLLYAGLHERRPWLAMELVEGCSLRDRLGAPARPLPPLEAVRVAAQVAAALEYTHAHGVIHRDLKPDNVLLDANGDVKVADFGLATLTATDAAGPALTGTGAVLGTYDYMAPEQRRDSSKVGPPADLYSLGAMLFELLTGYPPRGQESLETAAPEAPPRLARLVTSLLSPTPGERPESAATVRRELEQLHRLLLKETARRESVGTFLDTLPGQTRTLRAAKSFVAAATIWVPALVALALALWFRSAGDPGHSRAGAATMRTGSLSIETTPPGARILDRLSGEELGRSPALLTGLPEGLFSCELALPGYQRAVRETRIVAGKLRRESFALEKLSRRWVAGHVEYTNEKDGSVLIGVPEAWFEMGSAAGSPDEQPVHRVQLAPYFIGKSEVTWGQYRRFCKESGHPLPPDPAWRHDDRHPVVNVSWSDAAAYCDWAGLRLPTEAEWELAARGPRGADYPWGNDSPGPRTKLRGNFADESAGRLHADWPTVKGYDDGFPETAPTGSFPEGSSQFGCLDLAGNVWEWCSDEYDPAFYSSSPSRNPRGPVRAGDKGQTLPLDRGRALRGGSWFGNTDGLRCTARNGAQPAEKRDDAGFRVASGGE